MIKILLASFLLMITVSCGTDNNSHQTKKEMERLQVQNDSLKDIIQELNSKYIFDSISLRNIPDYRNTYDKNSKVAGEIVIVGYNLNKKTNVIFADSISFNPLSFQNPDTLKLINGGFQYEVILNTDQKSLKGIIESNSDYGQSFMKTYSSLISVKNK
jgi:hypothetical protein